MSGLYGPRRPRWEYMLLDPQNRPIGLLDGVSAGGSLTDEYQAMLGVSAQITVDERGQNIAWATARVRISYDPGTEGEEPWTLGVFLCSSPGDDHAGVGAVQYPVDLLSLLALAERDKLLERFTLTEGQPVIPAVLDLLWSITGVPLIAAVDSGAVLDVSQTFEVGDTKLEVANELLQSVGYAPLSVDQNGVYQVLPLVPVEQLGPVFTFRSGEQSLHAPEWSRRREIDDIKNRWVVFGQGTEDDPPITGVAEITDPESPWSVEKLGYVSVGVTAGIDADDQATYDALAQQYLAASIAQSAKFTVSHAVVPLRAGDVVIFHPSGEDPVRVQVQKVTYDLSFDGQCSADWVEVIPLG